MLRKSAILITAAIFLVVSWGSTRIALKAVNPTIMTSSSANITLFLCGDVMTGRGIDQVLPHAVDPRLFKSYVKNARDYVRLAEKKNVPIPQPVSYSYIWGEASQVWRRIAPDLKIINLETSITSQASPWPGKGIHYRMHPANISVLTEAHIDFCSLANNHTLDWGRLGLVETLQTLQKAGIAYAGAGQDPEAARKPAILKTKNGRVIILAYGTESSGIPANWAATSQQPGINLLPDLSAATVNQIKEQVITVKRSGDIVVFSVHWGSNWGYDIPANQRRFAHQLIEEAGVDIIHGHSSHHARGIEVYQDKLILYGAGDFINDYEGISGHEPFRGDLTLMYFPQVNPTSGKLIAMKMVPLQNKNFRLNRVSSADAKWLAGVLDREGRKLGTSIRLLEDGTFTLHW